MNHSIVAIVGAGRGLGRGAAEAFAKTGSTVLALARTESDLLDLKDSSPGVIPIVADARDADAAEQVINGHHPDVVVLAAGETPTMAPLDAQTWEQVSAVWENDVRLTHLWLSAILRAPLRPGSRVIVISSGAALVGGSPLSGGYAGAKAAQRFLARDAQAESRRRNLEITFTAVLPRLTPLTRLGSVASRAYPEWGNVGEAVRIEDALTPEEFGRALRNVAQMNAEDAEGPFLLTAAGLKPLS